MKISVVTVCFNSAATIAHTVDSFLQQKHPDKELLVVDGGSSDATIEIVRSFPQDQIIVWSEPDRGIFDAMNKGLARFTGDAVGFLNSDDRFHDPNVLTDVCEGLVEHGIVFGDIDFVADHQSSRIVRRWRSTPFRSGSFRSGWMAPHPSLYVRRQVAEAVGDFNLTYRISADYDWMLRAFELTGSTACQLKRTFVDMQVGGNSTRGLMTYMHGNLEALSARRRWLSAPPLDWALFAKPLAKISQFMTLSA